MARSNVDKGVALFNSGEYASAIEVFEACLSEGEDPEIRLFLRHAREALTGVAPGPPQEVVDVFTAVSKGDADALADASRRLFRRDHALAARVMRDLWIAKKDDAFTRGNAASSRSPWALFVRASIEWAAGRDAQALALVRRAARGGETSWMGHYAAEILARRMNRFEEALAAADRAVRTSPRFWEAAFFRAELRWALGAPSAKVLASLKIPSATAAHRPAALAWRGALKLWMGLPEEALVDLDRAAGPEHHDAYGWRGGARVLLGDLDGALLDLGRVLEKDADDHEALVWRGEALRRLGRAEESRRDLARAAGLSSEPPWAWANLARLELDQGRPREARDAFSRLFAPGRPVPALTDGEMASELERLFRAAAGVRRSDVHLNRAWMAASGAAPAERSARDDRFDAWWVFREKTPRQSRRPGASVRARRKSASAPMRSPAVRRAVPRQA